MSSNQISPLHLLDMRDGNLESVVMELMDCALSVVLSVVTVDGIEEYWCSFLVGAMPRTEVMERKDLLAANVKICKVQGEALDQQKVDVFGPDQPFCFERRSYGIDGFFSVTSFECRTTTLQTRTNTGDRKTK
ncbi:unnamed protein product [Allacma fusca]|uniref:Malate dehydrogenase, cytoplasmic n=1 Tax=Allacma fusca TaxID=39272 RepID=A0A8J2K311_9HEXA|nr:unnamed protein product [Allacma fusca]